LGCDNIRTITMKNMINYLNEKCLCSTIKEWETPDWGNQSYYGEECWGKSGVIEYTLPIGRVELSYYIDSNGVSYMESVKFFM